MHSEYDNYFYTLCVTQSLVDQSLSDTNQSDVTRLTVVITLNHFH